MYITVYEPRCEKTGQRGFRHKPGCEATEDGWKLEILFYEVEGLYYPCSENKGAYQLRDMQNVGFLITRLI